MKSDLKLIAQHVEIKGGSEGPRFDPYSWSEHTLVKTWDNDFTLVLKVRQGLMDKNTVNGKEISDEEFKSISGMEIIEFISMVEKVEYRKSTTCNCGSRNVRCANGYPGETLYICNKCNSIVHGTFDLSAVI